MITIRNSTSKNQSSASSNSIISDTTANLQLTNTNNNINNSNQVNTSHQNQIKQVIASKSVNMKVLNRTTSSNASTRQNSVGSAGNQIKYSNKSRGSINTGNGNGNNDSMMTNGHGGNVILQRPIILLKQNNNQQQHQKPNGITETPITLTSIKPDENKKPSVVYNGTKNGNNAAYSSNNEQLKQTSEIGANLTANRNVSNLSTLQPSIIKQPQAHLTSTSQTKVVTPMDEANLITSTSFHESLSARLNIKSTKTMSHSVRLLDESMQWCDHLQEYLVDSNSDYLVVGILGKRGVGKSTLMSLIAGNKLDERSRIDVDAKTVFRTGGKDLKESAKHKTNGIHAYVTSERTILLDVQPILSGSVIDKAISVEKQQSKSSGGVGGGSGGSGGGMNSSGANGSVTNNISDYKYYENFIEMQSIELTCFVLSVCNVVLFTEDWFSDPNLFRILQTAEMLMPNLYSINMSMIGSGVSSVNASIGIGSSSNLNPSVNASNASSTSNLSSQQEDGLSQPSHENYPHLIYILNKSDYISKLDIIKMKSYIDNIMRESKLIYKGSLREMSSHMSKPSLIKNGRGEKNGSNVNFIAIPSSQANDSTWQTMDRSVKHLIRELLAVRRTGHHVSSNLTEKRWFSYACKVWEAIKKSQLIGEYNRLMT